MRDKLGTDPRSARQDCFVRLPATDRPLTARELQLAADMQMAVGNTRRGELLSWQAHQVRVEVPA